MMCSRSYDNSLVEVRLNPKRPTVAPMEKLEASKKTKLTTEATQMDVIKVEQRSAEGAMVTTKATQADIISTS